MKYHNGGVLRTEQESTLKLMAYSQKRNFNLVEYLPFAILGILMGYILIKYLVNS
jgi:hypothetical protein